MDSSGAAYIFSADGMVPPKPPKIFLNKEETEQFVLFLAVLPIILILLPLIVFSGAIYLSNVHKTNKTIAGPLGEGDISLASQNPYMVMMSPLEEYAAMSVHGSASSSSDANDPVSSDMDTSLDMSSASVSSTTPFSLSTSRHGGLGASSGVSDFVQQMPRRPQKQQKQETGYSDQTALGSDNLVDNSSNNNMDRVLLIEKNKPVAIQEAIDGATEESSPMVRDNIMDNMRRKYLFLLTPDMYSKPPCGLLRTALSNK